MKLNRVRWGLALGGALAAEIVLIAAAFAWVAVYSYLVHPGESLAFYQHYAEAASPWVSLLAGMPVFYLACRWAGSFSPSKAWPTAMAIFGIFFLFDASAILIAGNPSFSLWFALANYTLKFLACYLGGKSASTSQIAQA